MGKVWFWRRAGWEHLRPIVWLVLLAVLLALVASGCGFPQTAPPKAKQQEQTAITVEWREHKLSAQAPEESAAKYIAPGVVGFATVFTAANPVMGALIYGATAVGMAAVEQSKSVDVTTQKISVPVFAGQSSRTERKPDGTTIIEVGPNVAPPAEPGPAPETPTIAAADVPALLREVAPDFGVSPK